ncbi:hypothetical protein J132_01571 [Termitomyces sp. J132]|nr:hypothetical protein H2248_008079 [Termitomyces sp. 'cryptogamus']KNZ75823.1 hypothetical protein J132_01571 [Termitomyces sp. J132]
MPIDILILGAGWTSTFLIPLCSRRSITYAATTRSGRDGTIAFNFDPESEDAEPFKILPDARTILITFPIVQPGASARLVNLYRSTHSASEDNLEFRTGFIQLGSTGIWDGGRTTDSDASEAPKPVKFRWIDRHTPFISFNDRANAESELLSLSSAQSPTTVLNLSGLWGGTRSPQNWVSRVAPSKDALRNKGNIHLIHGLDVSRAVLSVHADWAKAAGQRWILTDGRVYDWWDLASALGSRLSSSDPAADDKESADEERGQYARWVRELMQEENVRALPRDVECFKRALDSRDFWYIFGVSPIMARLN